ncbi:MAG TPA: DUF4252 domain-containing protein [Chitinophagales bacterium]|nr:DUF4252 domain-containing protein [Chitinophagales bacterium]
MKKLLTITMLGLIFNAHNLHANTPEKEGTKLNLWIPGLLIKVFTGISNDYICENQIEEKAALEFASKIGNINLCVREGDYYNVSDAKINRKINRMEKKEYEELIRVIDEGTHVNVSIKQKKNGNIKRLIVLVNEPEETYVYAKINCNVPLRNIQQLIQNMDLADL